MIAGSIGLLERPTDDILESDAGGAAALDVEDTQTYLDTDAKVQHGKACDRVETREERIHVDGAGGISVEEVVTDERVWTEWVADVTDAGFVAAERTSGGDPPFPFGLFWARTGEVVQPAEIDTGAFVATQREADDLLEVWYSGRDPAGREEVRMDYHGAAALAPGEDPNIGVGFRTSWGGKTVRGIIYASGYLAIYEDAFGPIQFASFIRDEILPHAGIPEDDDSEQTTLEADDEEADEEAEAYVEGVCEECGHERSKTTVNDVGDRVCILCEEDVTGGVSADD